MEIPCFKCQLLNAGRRDFSQWIENSLGSSLSWGKEGKRSNGRITVILIDSSSLLALYVYFFCDFFPPFIFYLIPVTLLLDPWTMAYSKNFKKKFFFNKNDQCSDIQPPSWSHRTLSVSRSQSWGYGRVSVCECVCACLGIWKGAQECCVLAVVCSASAAGRQQGVLQEPAPSQIFRKLVMWNHGFCN